MDLERRERKTKFKRQYKAKEYGPSRIEFDSDENREYNVPLDENKMSPIPTLSSCSAPSASRYLDEIALLKRGKITRDTPKHTYMRGNSKEDVPNVINEQPITIAELNTRGLKIDNNNIIYSIPNMGLPQREPVIFQQLQTSSTKSSPNDNNLNPSRNIKEFKVGNSGENSRLRICSSPNDGCSYELSTDNNICILQQNSKSVVLITWKN
ncbi:hypothetical protein DICVIV_01592 [Dictyocaulus viviparus]|uniref:Uncharacterized protein n=1 Tax=Dictyocaulus viviparus TaxID=29172 RepID=A0A0D8Y8G7_DICVI|nr:hypothetical protein DICVIV_01592 [Dictyocaulus viviparus]